jgi:hypothetical protein
MLSVNLAHLRQRLRRNRVRPNAGAWLRIAILGTGLGDRFEVSQGASGLFEGGERQAHETV